MRISVTYSDGEVVVAECEFSIHGSGPTEGAARAAFARIVAGTREMLEAREQVLGSHLRAQLEYLRSITEPVPNPEQGRS